jgi:hypothetical protein
MISLRTNVTDHATPAIEAKIAACSPKRLRAIVGPALNSHVKRHLVGNGTNKKGYSSTNFWADAARGTSWYSNASDGVVIVAINKIGVRQRFHGGVIKPVKASALAIPISPVSYGHVPKDFPDLFLLKTKRGAYLCQRDAGAKGKESKTHYKKRAGSLGGNSKRRLRSQINFLFKLVASVTQKADPSVIPSADELMEVAMARIEEAVK